MAQAGYILLYHEARAQPELVRLLYGKVAGA